MSQQINLFNPLLLKKKKVFSALPMLRALAVLVCGALALAYAASHSVDVLQTEASAGAQRLKQRQMRQAEVNGRYGVRQKDTALESQIALAQAELDTLKKVSLVLQGGEFGNSHGYSAYFNAFARQRMEGLWLTGMAIDGPGSQISVQGRALRPDLVPAYIERLTREPMMQGKTFASLQIKQGSEQAAPGQDSAALALMAPFVEFNLQSTATQVTAPEAASR